jgi:two-component system sensor histidine kinase/response regulator
MSAEVAQLSTLKCMSPVGIFHTDAEGRCLAVNSRWCEITGLKLEEALGEGWAQALHPDDSERTTKEWNRATREQDSTFEAKFRFRRPDGTITPVLAQALQERDARGKITGFIGAITDLSGQIEADSEVEILDFLKSAGFEDIDITVVDREKESPNFQTLLAIARKK